MWIWIQLLFKCRSGSSFKNLVKNTVWRVFCSLTNQKGKINANPNPDLRTALQDSVADHFYFLQSLKIFLRSLLSSLYACVQGTPRGKAGGGQQQGTIPEEELNLGESCSSSSLLCGPVDENANPTHHSTPLHRPYRPIIPSTTAAVSSSSCCIR